MRMPVVQIPGRALVTVSSAEAQHFLQNIVTADVDALPDKDVRPCALLSPQGKILFDFLVSRDGEGFRLDCRTDIAADLARRLTLYRLRAKVDIATQQSADVFAGWDGAANSEAAPPRLRDTRFPTDAGVWRSYAPQNAEADEADWNGVRVQYGVAESGVDFTLGDAFPHDVLLDQNGGVGLRKGCFVGQEVVSRMQHRGTARRRILVAQSEEALPPAGTEVVADERPIGTLGTVVGRLGIALVRIDRVADALAAGTAIHAAGVALTLSIPPGMRFTFPQASPEQAAAD